MKIITNDADFIETIHANLISEFKNIETKHGIVGPLKRIPGATWTLYSLAVDSGLMAFPAGFLASTLSNYFVSWYASKGKNAPRPTITIHVQNKSAEVDVSKTKEEIMKIIDELLE